jgi:urease accessory protein
VTPSGAPVVGAGAPGAVTADARIATVADGRGGTRVHTLRGDGPLAPREAAGAVYLVGAAAGPLAGDRWALRCDVGADSVLRLRSAASTVLLPGPAGTWSLSTVDAHVASGGLLDHAPEPVVAARGCRHRQRAAVDLAAGASLCWREELVLGRHGEVAGECELHLDVTYAGVPLLRHALAVGPSSTGPAVLGAARAVGAVVLAGPAYADGAPPHAEPGLVVTPLAGPGVLVLALADGAASLRLLLDRALRGQA